MKPITGIMTAFLLLICVSVQGQERSFINLNTSWEITSIATDAELDGEKIDRVDPSMKWYRGNMPKQVQEFIYENGELPDPAVNHNTRQWVKVFEKDWIYSKVFETPDFKGDIQLCFDGLDTQVDLFLNGNKLACCNNMFRRWKIPVSHSLNPVGEKNRLILRFYPPQQMMDQFKSQYSDSTIPAKKFIRKTAADFSSYMGAKPHFMKVGIFDRVYLDLLPEAYFGDVQIQSFLANDFSSADLKINPDLKGDMNKSIAYKIFTPKNLLLTQGTAAAGSFNVAIEKPELWYPMNYGKQPLYKIQVSLVDKDRVLDTREISFGIRDLQIVQQDTKTGQPLFCVQVNGQKIFMNGACWAPLHGFTHVWNEERANRLLELMKLGNMNFLRLWGEGSYPGTSFFNFCNQYGIVVMMDFMTANDIEHPLFDQNFKENITLEIHDVIARYRNHPCIGFWDGGNENYLSHRSNLDDNTKPIGRELFHKIMPEAVATLDSQRYFHPSSPWGGDNWVNGNYPLAGDFHDYSTVRFQPLATVPLFTTEVCMVSPYAAHQMRKFMSEEAFWPAGFRFIIDYPGKKAWPPGWEDHSIGSGWQKIGRIQDFCDIQNEEDACRVLGVAHGDYLKDRYERQRRGVPDGAPDDYRRSWGAAIWRLNDSWPMIYMSVVDYYLEPKIPYYFLKRACEPVLISFEQTDEKICVWVVNDTPQKITDSLVVQAVTFDGEVKKRCSQTVELQPSESKRVIDLTHHFHDIQKRNEFLVARFANQEKAHLMFPEKFLELKKGTLQAEYLDGAVILKSDKYVKGVELLALNTSGAVFSDNYFDLLPGQTKKIAIIDRKEADQIRIKGLNSEVLMIKVQ